MLAALAEGPSRVRHFGFCDDTWRTLAAIRRLGSRVLVRDRDVRIVPCFRFPSAAILRCGESGTTLALLAGALAGRAGTFRLAAAGSLRWRSIDALTASLRRLGVRFRSRRQTPPLVLAGGVLDARLVRTQIASAQLKSAILLAGLRARGWTRVREPIPTRDHTERMLRRFGADVRFGPGHASVRGPCRLRGTDVTIPGDPSAAAFFLVGAAAAPGSRVSARGIAFAPARSGFVSVLRRMGAEIVVRARPPASGERVADVEASGRVLRAVRVGPDEIPSIVDEIPVLAIAASVAGGTTTFRGAGRLRGKESDRLEGISEGIHAFGATASVRGGTLTVTGARRLRAAHPPSRGDHRLAMAFAVARVLAGAADVPRADRCAAKSYPDFGRDLRRLAG